MTKNLIVGHLEKLKYWKLFSAFLKGGWKQFPVLSKTYSLMGHYNHPIPADAKIQSSGNDPIIREHIAANFVTQKVSIATIWPPKNTLNFSLKHL